MAMDFDASFPAIDPIHFAPIGWRQRAILADKLNFTDNADLAKAINWLLAKMHLRNYSTLFRDDLIWTDTAYSASSEVSWRQPYSPGIERHEFRFHVKIDGGAAGEIRVRGSDGATWYTGAVAAGGAWQDIDISNVDTDNGPAVYFEPVLQAKVNVADTIRIRTMAVQETDLASIPLTGIDGVGGQDVEHQQDDDEPLSADSLEEMVRTALWLYDRRTKVHFLRILPDGAGSHPDNTWTTADGATMPFGVQPPDLTGVVARFMAELDPVHLTRSLTVLVEGKTSNSNNGSLEIYDRHGHTDIVTWLTGDTAYTWKTLTVTPGARGRGDWPSRVGTEWFLNVLGDITVRNVVAYSSDTSERF